MRKIKSIKDVVDWGLCTGCGACYYFCSEGAISLANIESVGIRPIFTEEACPEYQDCLSVCPGYRVNANVSLQGDESDRNGSSILIGPALRIWEGYATNKTIRYHGSSGGILTALASYCLEKENMQFVLHTGMDPLKPWLNKTVVSMSKDELIGSAGSRYATSSPCDSLRLIEESSGPCVFIGKPCDAAAVTMLRNVRPRLNVNLGLVLTMFCAGTPSTTGTRELLSKLNIDEERIEEIKYRGEGWPGEFKVRYDNGKVKSLSYKESWGQLQKYRPFRCHLCPDALGEMADISSGDAWNRYEEGSNDGVSLVLARTQRGNEMLIRARESGYVFLKPSDASRVIAAQPIIERRNKLFGRFLAMRFLLVPIPKFSGFFVYQSWRQSSLFSKIRTVLGTLRRIVQRGLCHRNNYF